MFANYFGGFMKKIIVLFFALIFLGGNAFAISDTAEFEKSFYDGFLTGFFRSLPDSLVANGHSRVKADKYATALKSRVNRQQLEQQTWGCVSQASINELATQQQKVAEKCFGPWVTQFMGKNADLYQLLK